ncbi:MAG: hypothetical protein ACREM3_22820 [Candidatus Rokuibacteriota bacterium]
MSRKPTKGSEGKGRRSSPAKDLPLKARQGRKVKGGLLSTSSGVVTTSFRPKGAVGPCFNPRGVIAPCD